MLLLAACVQHDPERPGREPEDTVPDDGVAAWTWMVYIVGDNDLEDWVMHDLDELEAGGPGGEVRVMALADRAEGYSDAGGDWTGTRLYEVIGDGPAGQVTSEMLEDWGEQDMADPATLATFLESAAALAPAERYALVLWDHGTSWYANGEPPPGIGWDMTSEDEMSIAEGELDDGLSAFTEANGPFEVIAFDACNMAYFEIGHALRGHGRHLVAAQTSVGMDGLQYTPALQALVADPAMESRDLADTLARDPVEDTGEMTFSATDLSQMDALASALDAFAAVALEDAEAWEALLLAREESRGAEPGESWRLWSMDLGDLADQAQAGGSTALADAASTLRVTMDGAIVGAYGIEDFAWTGGLNLYADTRGLSVYAGGSGATWAEATRWDEVLLQIEQAE